MRVIVLIASVLCLGGCAAVPPPGQMVDVGGYRMHITCAGPESTAPTVIIDAGFRGFSPMYSRLHNALAEQVRVCSYDRSGLGWSDASDTARDAEQMARELHKLLGGAGVKPPYVLAGHSLGGLVVLRYSFDYPREVAGLALLDSTHPQQDFSPEGRDASIESFKNLRLLARLGFTYFYTPAGIKSRIDPLPEDAREQMMYFVRSPSMASKMLTTAIGELEGMEASFAQGAEVTSVGDLPLVVITAKPYPLGPDATEEDQARWQQRVEHRYQLHEQFTALSTRGRHVQLDEGYHESMIFVQSNADRVAAEIMSVVEETRAR